MVKEINCDRLKALKLYQIPGRFERFMFLNMQMEILEGYSANVNEK